MFPRSSPRSLRLISVSTGSRKPFPSQILYFSPRFTTLPSPVTPFWSKVQMRSIGTQNSLTNSSLEGLTKLSPNGLPLTSLRKAHKMVNNGQFKAAVSFFSSFELDSLDQLLKICESGLTSLFLLARASALIQRREYERARDDYDFVISKMDRRLAALVAKGELLFTYLNDWPDALKMVDLALESGPFLEALILRHRILKAMHHRDVDIAATVLKDFIPGKPDWEMKADYMMQLGEYGLAIQAYAPSVRQRPEDGQLLFKVASCFYNKKKPRKALEFLNQALKAKSTANDWRVYSLRAKVYSSLKEEQLAAADIQEAEKLELL